MAYLLDQAIELAGPKTLSGKALLKSKQALHRGDDKTAGKYLYHAFDNLPKKHTDTPLTPKEKQLIEDQLAKLFQKNVTINCKLVDKLANKSYVHLQTGGSIVSYRYLLEALDLARLPIPKSLQKMAQVGSPKLQSTKLQSRCGQVGGSVPLIVGGVSAGLAILGLIILWIRHRNQPTSKLETTFKDPLSLKYAVRLDESGLSDKEKAANYGGVIPTPGGIYLDPWTSSPPYATPPKTPTTGYGKATPSTAGIPVFPAMLPSVPSQIVSKDYLYWPTNRPKGPPDRSIKISSNAPIAPPIVSGYVST